MSSNGIIRLSLLRAVALLLVFSGLVALEVSFAPPARAGTVSTLLAPTTVHADGAELVWTRYTLAAGESFASYEVHRSTVAAFTPSGTTRLTIIRDHDATRWRDTTARPSTAFSYKIVSNGLVSNERRVTMAANDRTIKILQPDSASGQASYILRHSAAAACLNDWNYGSSTNLRVGTSISGYTHRPVLRFDLRDIPARSTVVSATMTLSYSATANPATAVNVHRLLQPWEEGTNTGQCGVGGVSWNEIERGVKWKTGGAAYDAVVDYQLPAKARTTAGADQYPVTNLVKKWVDGAPNHGLLLKIPTDVPPSTTANPWFDYSSDDSATASARPKLQVEYIDLSKATGPRATVVSPAQGSIVRGTVALTASAGDDQRVDRVEFFIDGAATPVATDTSPPWSGTWNTTTATAGTHTITVRATDDVGQQKTSGGRTVTVDNSAKPTLVSLTVPAAGASLANTVTMNGAASDDGGVTLVEFYVDDHVVGTDTVAPYSVSWNTLDPAYPALDGSHQLKVRAYDAGGQWTDSSVVTVSTVNTNGSKYKASFDLNQLGPSDDPFSVPPLNAGNELAVPFDAYSGSTTLRTLASDPVPTTYPGGPVESIAGPDSAAADGGTVGGGGTVDANTIYVPPPNKPKSVNAFQCEVTVTNNSTVAWKGDELQLWYRWYTADGTILFEGTGTDYFPQTVQPGQSKRIPITVEPPALPQGIDMSQVRLRFDIVDYASTAPNKWFAGRGNPPVDNPVVVNRLLEGNLGLERYWQYEGDEAGAGMATLTNVSNGNMLLRWSPFFAPGRGLATMLDLTYNSLEDHSKSPAGNNVSLSISGLNRFGEPLDIHPNHADTISGKSNKYVVLTDGDGTTHKFTGVTNTDGTTTWTEPPGVNLYLRSTTDPNPARRWALTRPDNVTFFFDPDGYPTPWSTATATRSPSRSRAHRRARTPGGPKKRITKVTDAAGRTFAIDYFSKAEAKKAHVRGKIQRIMDHSGSRWTSSTTTTATCASSSSAAAPRRTATHWPIGRSSSPTRRPTAPDRPSPTPPCASIRTRTRRTSPRGSTACATPRCRDTVRVLRAGLGPAAVEIEEPDEPQRQRHGCTSANTAPSRYDIATRRTTVDAPLTRDTDYLYDTGGKVTSIVDPREQTTQLQWSADLKVTKLTEPGGRFDLVRLQPQRLPADGDRSAQQHDRADIHQPPTRRRDALGHWSLLATVTKPRGTASATVGDYQWRFTYDAAGNIDLVTDPSRLRLQLRLEPAPAPRLRAPSSRVTDPERPASPPSTTTPPGSRAGSPTPITESSELGYDVDGLMVWMQDANHTGGRPAGLARAAYRTYFDYDTFHRLGRQSSPKSTQFDRGRMIWSSAPTIDANDNIVRQIDPHYGGTVDDGEDGPTRTARFDAMDQLIEQANPDKTVDPAGERTVRVGCGGPDRPA